MRARYCQSFRAARRLDRGKPRLGQGLGDDLPGGSLIVYDEHRLICRYRRQRLGTLPLLDIFFALRRDFHRESRTFAELALDADPAADHPAEAAGYAEAKARSAVG